MERELIEHFRKIGPALDRNALYAFFFNNKVGFKSVNRYLLKDRSIVRKDDEDFYNIIFRGYEADRFEHVYKFTIVRNPWDRVVSAYFYFRRYKAYSKDYPFDQYVKDLREKGVGHNKHFYLQYDKAFFDGKQFVDFIGRIENIEEDWKEIAANIRCPKSLPHKNKSKHKHYSEYYTSETADIVYGLYKKDIETFNYRF